MDRLPVELVLAVIQNLDTEDLAALVRTSRRYYKIGIRELFSNVSFLFEEPEELQWKLPSFLNAIALNPELGAAVHTLHLDAWLIAYEGRMVITSGFETEIFERAVREQAKSEKETANWNNALDKGEMEAYFALMLPRLTNLRFLEIADGDQCNFVADVLAQGTNETSSLFPLFPKLEHACVGSAEDEGIIFVDVDTANLFFSFPSMTRICGNQIQDGSSNSNGKTRFSSITEIDLQNSGVVDGLVQWIEMCRALKSLRLRYHGPIDFKVKTFRDSLELHKSHLERLWLDSQEPDWLDESVQELGSLAHFTSLKILYMSVLTLVGLDDEGQPLHELGDILCGSLEIICLDDCPSLALEWLPYQIERMIKNDRTPNLRTLIIDGTYVGLSDLNIKKRFQPVHEAIEGTGISLELGTTDYMLDIWPCHDHW